MNWDEIPNKNDPLIKIFRELDKVKSDHRSLVLVTNGFLELLVETLIRARCRNHKKILDDSRSYSYSAKLLLLNEVNAISDTSYRNFEWFRKLRNRAAHDPFFTVSVAELPDIADGQYALPKDIKAISVQLFAGFWNAHVDVFAPVFSPGTASVTDK